MLALLAAALWALSCVIDVCFVGEGIFTNPMDGTVITGLFCILPLGLLLPQAGAWHDVPMPAGVAAASAGIFYFLHVYFYFRALFALNDGSNAEIFNNLTVLFVPFLAFVILGERLPPVIYVATLLAFAGVIVLLRGQVGRIEPRLIFHLMLAVVCVSLSTVLQAGALQQIEYANAVVIFSVACFLCSVLVVVANRSLRRNTVGLCRRFGAVFVAMQAIDIAAVLASQRSTEIAPSVTLVAITESTLPLFIMIFSLGTVLVLRYRSTLSARVRAALLTQTSGWHSKTLSLLLIVSAIAVMQFGLPN